MCIRSEFVKKLLLDPLQRGQYIAATGKHPCPVLVALNRRKRKGLNQTAHSSHEDWFATHYTDVPHELRNGDWAQSCEDRTRQVISDETAAVMAVSAEHLVATITG